MSGERGARPAVVREKTDPVLGSAGASRQHRAKTGSKRAAAKPPIRYSLVRTNRPLVPLWKMGTAFRTLRAKIRPRCANGLDSGVVIVVS
jgi:hypothetical protein